MPTSADFFARLEPKLSQGDIVDGVPWGLVDDPVLVCRPVDRSKPSGKASYAPVDVVVPPKGMEAIHARARFGLTMVLWHDCQIDKFENQERPPEKWFAAIAPLLPLPAGNEVAAGNIRDGKRRAFFPVPAYPDIGLAEDRYVDLRHIWPVKQSLLKTRLGALSPAAKNLLFGHLFSFLTQRRFEDTAVCPGCSNSFPLERFFPSLNEEQE